MVALIQVQRAKDETKDHDDGIDVIPNVELSERDRIGGSRDAPEPEQVRGGALAR
jgi:hypothetical protein